MTDGAVGIVGGGAWGTALAVHLGRLETVVRLWMREPDLVERMRSRRDNPVYLPGVPVPDAVVPTNDIAEAVCSTTLLVAAIPSPFARSIYRAMRDVMEPGAGIVVATKGIEADTLALPADVAASELGPDRRIAVISGPSFAAEVARGRPTALVVASSHPGLSEEVQTRLSGPVMRLYTNDDVLGVQLAGALKNVIAIAAGIVEGTGLGHNTLAALVTRGLAEMSRLGEAMGGRAETFGGLAGLGDLLLTCTGELSRNRAVGIALARGSRLNDVLAATRHVPEGVRTTESALALARRHGVGMPIVEEVHRILQEQASPREAVERLMARPLTSERESRMEPRG